MMFLHLSDIHLKSKEVKRDDDPNAALRNDIVDDVRKMRAKIGRAADAILISGDIAFAGAEDEYVFATAWLKEQLCPAADCSMDDIFVIPGNHDVDRGKAAARMHADARANLRQLPAGGGRRRVARLSQRAFVLPADLCSARKLQCVRDPIRMRDRSV